MEKVKRGFTLVEVLTVILIIGILTTLTTYTYNSSLARSRDSQRLTDLKSIQNSLEQYYLDKRSYPNYKHTTPFNSSTGFPHIAIFQLENFPVASWPGCDPDDTGKTYLAPNYMSTIPEDPMRKAQLDNCQIVNSSPAGTGQYHYVPFMAANDLALPITGYYLFGKVERRNNVTTSLAPIRDAFLNYPFTRSIISLPSGESGNGAGGYPYNYCSKGMTGDPTVPGCHFNYFLGNKDR